MSPGNRRPRGGALPIVARMMLAHNKLAGWIVVRVPVSPSKEDFIWKNNSDPQYPNWYHPLYPDPAWVL